MVSSFAVKGVLIAVHIVLEKCNYRQLLLILPFGRSEKVSNAILYVKTETNILYPVFSFWEPENS